MLALVVAIIEFVAFPVFAPAVDAAEGTRIQLASVPGGAPAPATLTTSPDATSGSTPVFVSEADRETTPGVVRYATPPSGVSLRFARPGGEASSAVTIELAAGGVGDSAVAATWDDVGGATVPLYARVGDQVHSAREFVVSRSSGAALVVVGASDGKLAIASTGPKLQSQITIQTGVEPATGVEAKVTNLVDAATGAIYTVEESTTEIGDLAAHAPASVPLVAELPYAGTFTGTLTITHDGITDPPMQVTVARTLAAAGVTIDMAQSSSFSYTSPYGDLHVERAIVLTETLGRSALLQSPVLVTPTTTATGSTADAGAAHVTTLKVEPDQSGCRVEGNAVSIDAGEACRVLVTIAVPSSPGQYEGTLRFASPGAAVVEQQLTIQVRRGWVWAIGALALGLAAGWVIHRFVRDRRARLGREVGIARLDRELTDRLVSLPGGLRDDTERTAYGQLRAHVAALAPLADPSGPGPSTFDDRLAVMQTLVTVFVPWATLRRAVLNAPVPVRTPRLEEVERIRSIVTSPNAPKAEADALGARVSAAFTALRTAETILARSEVERFRDEVATILDESERAAIDAQIDRAAELVASGEGSPDQARHELTGARRLTAEALAKRLDLLVDDPAVPFGMTADSWARLGSDVRDRLAAAEIEGQPDPLDGVRDAYRYLLIVLVDRALTKVRADLGQIPRPLSDADTRRKDALTAVRDKLGAARRDLQRDDLAAAYASWEDARSELATASTGGFLDQAASTTTLPAIGALPARSTGPVAEWGTAATVVPISDEASLRRSWNTIELILAALTFVLGVLVGLQALYVSNPTWGSPADLLVAVLWGAGVSQVAGAAHQGYAGVRTSLIGA